MATRLEVWIAKFKVGVQVSLTKSRFTAWILSLFEHQRCGGETGLELEFTEVKIEKSEHFTTRIWGVTSVILTWQGRQDSTLEDCKRATGAFAIIRSRPKNPIQKKNSHRMVTAFLWQSCQAFSRTNNRGMAWSQNTTYSEDWRPRLVSLKAASVHKCYNKCRQI